MLIEKILLNLINFSFFIMRGDPSFNIERYYIITRIIKTKKDLRIR